MKITAVHVGVSYSLGPVQFDRVGEIVQIKVFGWFLYRRIGRVQAIGPFVVSR
jgi:hypothetical protein